MVSCGGGRGRGGGGGSGGWSAGIGGLCGRAGRARQGEAECFGVLFDRHGEAVRAFCARRTGSMDAADDLVSMVFLQAWRRRAEVELIDRNALPWLYGIARRSMQHRWRTARRHRRALRRLVPAPAMPDHADEVAGR